MGVFWPKPPVLLDGTSGMVAAVQAFLPLPADDGAAAQSSLDVTVRVRTLFVCGTDDEYLLCGRAYAAKQKQFVAADLATLNVACGHNLVDEAQCPAATQVHKALTEHILAEAPIVAAAPTCDTVAHGACSKAFDVNGGSTAVCGDGPGSFRTYDKCSNRTNCQIAISQAMRDAVAAMCTANPLAAPQPPPPPPSTKPPPTNAPAQASSSQSGASSTVKSSAASAALSARLALVRPVVIVACIMVLKLAAAGVSL